MKRFLLNKLVRDNIVETCLDMGGKPSYRVLSKDELFQALKNKIQEEALEIAEAEDQENLLEEIADVQEVLLEIMKVSGISQENVILRMKEKNQVKGAFSKAHYIDYVDLPGDCEMAQYCMCFPNKYPEKKDK
ncbi:nucleoside triphosphate pyrophosphohydrolase [Candidatus Babeliales bacterium]|nr:nucleoside triphosphate pyrophosphohydrolase [Candidatus Babeliales bacterium]